MLLLLATISFAEPPPPVAYTHKAQHRMVGADIGRVLLTSAAGGLAYWSVRDGASVHGITGTLLLAAGSGASWAQRPVQRRTLGVDMRSWEQTELQTQLRSELAAERLVAMKALLWRHDDLTGPALTVTDVDELVRRETIRQLSAWAMEPTSDSAAAYVLLRVGLDNETDPRLQRKWAFALGDMPVD